LSHSASLFLYGFFWDRFSQTICLQLASNRVARIIGMSHWCLASMHYSSYICDIIISSWRKAFSLEITTLFRIGTSNWGSLMNLYHYKKFFGGETEEHWKVWKGLKNNQSKDKLI
jgi:hypothetical protein